MTKLNIVAVPFHDWKKSQAEGFRTRDVHLLQELIQHPLVNRLLIVDRPTSVVEMLLLRRPWHIHGGQSVYQRNRSRLTMLNEKTFVLDMYNLEVLNPLLKRRRWIPASYGTQSTAQAVSEAIDYLGLDEYVLFMSSPLPMPLYRQLHNPTLVVDAVDNLLKIPQFSDMNAEISGYYDEIRQQASVVFSNTVETAAFLSREDRQAIYIPNGVDFRHFHPSDDKIPADLKPISHPIVGYAGKMQEIFDVDMLRSVANALPNVTFVCIGQLLNPKWMKSLWELPNVRYLGDKHYDQLPSYLANFDICMIPYSVERQHNNDPIKFYEYLAMGKPVVTTRIGGVGAFAHYPQVKIVADGVEFIAAVKYYLELIEKGNKLSPQSLPDSVLWSAKADQMVQLILQKSSAHT